VRVRSADAADIPAMMELERQSPAAGHWPRRQYEGLFVQPGDQLGSERFAWVAEDGSDAPQVLGFLVAHRVDSEWELENIVVAGSVQRRGVGTRLLRELVSRARSERGSQIFLEVRESNRSARALYGKMGFEEKGLRKSYYADPPEDAILCRLTL
jgi:ribosomal-protein-alanine N-acetyltransferase